MQKPLFRAGILTCHGRKSADTNDFNDVIPVCGQNQMQPLFFLLVNLHSSRTSATKKPCFRSDASLCMKAYSSVLATQ